MTQAPILKLEIPFDLRIENCLENYTTQNINDLKSCVLKISSKLGPLNTKNALAALDKGDLRETAIITLKYYDKNYDYTYSQKKQTIINIPSDTIDVETNTHKILNHIKDLYI
jgi:tRNA 2-selenouridine synthase